MKVKGLAMKKIGEVGWVEKDKPEIGRRDAFIRPIAVAPCSSDVHTVFDGTLGDLHDAILGHEAVGIVEEVGDEVRDFKPGDRVIVPAIVPDWDCEAIQNGNPQHAVYETGYCQKIDDALGAYKFTAVVDGVFANLFKVTQADMNLAILPDEVSVENGVMISDMVTTGFHGVENADIKFGDTVVVLGIGPVGLMAVAGAKLNGAGRIFAVGSRPNLVKLAKEYGATDIIDYHDGDTVEQVMEKTDCKGADAVIIAGGNESIMMDAINMTKAGGNISNVNYFSKQDTIPIPLLGWGMGMSHKTIKGGLCPGGRNRMERLIDMVKYGRLDPSKMISHKFNGFDSIEDSLILMKDKPRELIKPIVYLE